MASDPSSYTGAASIGLAFPMRAADIIALQFCGAQDLLGAAKADMEPTPAPEEPYKTKEGMSALFNR